MQLSSQQATGAILVSQWLKECKRRPLNKQVFRLFGYAGTGKSTILKHLVENENVRYITMTFTGKAASVLVRKGTPAGTIHSTIYKIIEPDAEKIKELKKQIKDTVPGSKAFDALRSQMIELSKPRFELKSIEESGLSKIDLIVLDEVSMVDEQLGQDILSFDKPVLVLGDPGQLPPVSGTGFFVKSEPDVMLTEVHRQAGDSPIIKMATLVRQGHRLYKGTYGDSLVYSWQNAEPKHFGEFDQVIVGMNKTRNAVNSSMRDRLGYTSRQPVEKDKIICLRNNKELGLMNGTQWRVLDVEDNGTYLDLEIESWDDANGKSRVLSCHQFGTDLAPMAPWERFRYNEFDYGYAITCHKSQGSQWPTVYIRDESWAFREDAKRWLYTALTRAETKVMVAV